MQKKEFVTGLTKRIGYPLWDKAMIATSKGLAHRGASGDSSSIIYIPFAIPDSNTTAAVLAVRQLPSDTLFSLCYPQHYQQFGFDTTAAGWNARNVYQLFTEFDYTIFGHTDFLITDGRIFGQDAVDTLLVKRRPAVGSRESYQQRQSEWIEECVNYLIYGVTYQQRSSTSMPAPLALEVCTVYWNEEGMFGGGGIGTGGGGGGGGGGGSIGGNWALSYPCTGAQPRGKEEQVPCGSGWVWVPNPPYICYYQMTQHEIDVFNQLNAEDDLSDQIYQNQDCKGTKAGGNINFQGTKEHWLIQLDYVSKNFLYGEMEFQIPFASITNPTNRGRADIANTLNGNMFEIKPNDPANISNGVSEIQNYVAKANQYCTSTLPLFTTWNHGTLYETTFIPTGLPNYYLKAEFVAPGVIGYSYVILANPIPSPVLVPSSIIDKFKELIERLKQNLQNADKIIAEFLNQHPELLTFIKTVAIGAGVAIIIGTILEDIVTGGAGILDDWASFMLAKRIIRFALAL